MTLTENTQLKRIVQDLEIFFFFSFFFLWWHYCCQHSVNQFRLLSSEQKHEQNHLSPVEDDAWRNIS